MNETITPRSIRNNNPLNIRKGDNWLGEKAGHDDDVYEQFESLAYGIRAGFKIIKNYMSGYNGAQKPRTNVHDIITRWINPGESDADMYVKRVCSFTGLHPYETIKFTDRNHMIALVDAMIRIECGQRVNLELIASAYDLLNFKG